MERSFKADGLSPREEIEHAILRIEGAFQALDFGGEPAAEDAQAHVRRALRAIRYQLARAAPVEPEAKK